MSTEDAASSSPTPADAGGEPVVAVDADDNELDIVDRLEAHTGDGIRHRAFTCLLFDEAGRLLLAQRAPAKRLWDTYWDGTVASTPPRTRASSRRPASASRRSSASPPTSTTTSR